MEANGIKDRAIEKLKRELGRELLDVLREPDVIEIVMNPDSQIWVERLGQPMLPMMKMRPSLGRAIIETVAGYHGVEINAASPLLEGELPLDGSRFAAQIPPIVTGPTFAIRKRAIKVYTLDDYVEQGALSKKQKDYLDDAIKNHRNILVVGGTGSGKTTLVNAIIESMVRTNPEERIVIIEDTGEIQCSAKNFVQYHTSEFASMTRLLRATLRMRPDRILVGEVRGEEALDLLDAWNTGHEGGAATIHANNATAALDRLKQLTTRNPFCPSDVECIIGQVVHTIVCITKTPQGRKIDSIIEVEGYRSGNYVTNRIQ